MTFLALVLTGFLLGGPQGSELPPVLGVEGTTEEIGRKLRAAEREFRKEWGGLTIAELSPAPVDDNVNRAFPIIETVHEFKKLMDKDQRAAIGKILSDFDIEEAGSYVASHLDELLGFQRGRDRLVGIDLLPEANFGLDHESYARNHPFSAIDGANTAKLLTVYGLADISTGNCEDAVRGFETVLAFSDAFSAEPDALYQISRRSAGLDAVGLLRGILERCELKRKTLEHLTLNIDRDRPPPRVMTFDDHLIHQQLMFENVARGLSDDDGGTTLNRVLLAARLQALKFASKYATHANTPRWQRSEAPSLEGLGIELTWDNVSEAEDDDGEGEKDKLEESNVPEDPEMILEVLLHLSNYINEYDLDRSDLWDVRFQLASTAVALVMYSKDHDAYPASLADLIPRYLGEIPIDPFVGTPLEYEPTDDGYKLTAAKQAYSAWRFDADPVLDWSRPREKPAAVTD